MKRNSLVKCIISTVLCISCLMGTITSASAIDNNVLPKGDADVSTSEQSLIEQFEELLLNSNSVQERQAILKKAYQMGIDETEFTNVSLSENDVAILNGDIVTTNSIKNDRAILTANVSTASVISTNSTLAGVSMPT